MKVVVKWSLILVILVVVLNFAVIVSGIYTNPFAALGFVFVAVVLNVIVVFMALAATATDNPYAAQLRNGLLIGLLAGVLIFLSSWLTTAVIFPDYIEQMKAGYIAVIQDSGLPDESLQTQIENIEKITAFGEAVKGLMGTFFTSVVAAAIVAIFKRRK